MPNNNRAVGAQFAHGSDISYKLWRENITTRVTVLQLPNNPHYTPDCGHRAPHVRHVGSLDGPARYLCRRCWLSALAAEEQAGRLARVRAQFNKLFSVCPSANWLRGAIGALLGRAVAYA
jgi:hypothetical protein